MDKRTARREHMEGFSAAIADFNSSSFAKKQQQLCRLLNVDKNGNNGASIRVVVRKRPIFEKELEAREFDVICCPRKDVNTCSFDALGNSTVPAASDIGIPMQQPIVVHDCRMHADMKRRFIDHHCFRFDRVFSEQCDNDTVYGSEVSRLVSAAVSERTRAHSTVLMYGQTGSGKTHTMSSIYTRAAEQIFREKPAGASVRMTFYELNGESGFDLLNSMAPVRLCTAQDGSIHPVPVASPEVASAAEMQELISSAGALRLSAETVSNSGGPSSRTHAILKIFIQQNQPRVHKDGAISGSLTLVDLAGSENRVDSLRHNAARRREGALINTSLMALKDCVRARATGSDVSHLYRQSKLTMALKESFGGGSSPAACDDVHGNNSGDINYPGGSVLTTVIVTVSPKSTDTEQTLNSLRHASVMAAGSEANVAAKAWEHENGTGAGAAGAAAGSKDAKVISTCGRIDDDTTDVSVEVSTGSCSDSSSDCWTQELGVVIPQAVLQSRAKKAAEAARVFTFIDPAVDSAACQENKRAIQRIEEQLMENQGEAGGTRTTPVLSASVRAGLKKRLAVLKAKVSQETRARLIQGQEEMKSEVNEDDGKDESPL